MLFQSSSDYYSYKCIKNEVNNKTMWDEKSMVKKKTDRARYTWCFNL